MLKDSFPMPPHCTKLIGFDVPFHYCLSKVKDQSGSSDLKQIRKYRFYSLEANNFVIINGRDAIAENIIVGLLLVFYNSKNFNCIGALSFLRIEEEYWRSPFFNQFYWSEF